MPKNLRGSARGGQLGGLVNGNRAAFGAERVSGNMKAWLGDAGKKTELGRFQWTAQRVKNNKEGKSTERIKKGS